MSKKHVAVCRLCATETWNRVAIYSRVNPSDNRVEELIKLVGIEVNRKTEPKAVVCYECFTTLEEFYRFKIQCQENDKRMRNNCQKSVDSKALDQNTKQDETTHSGETSGNGQTNEKISNAKVETVVSPGNSSTQNKAVISSQGAADNEVLEGVNMEDEYSKVTGYSKIPTRLIGLSALNKMLVLSESYGKFFHFVKRSRSIYYDLVFEGEHYNSALFTPRITSWQCIYRKKLNCKARICCTNDYKHFEKKRPHSHGILLPKKSGVVFQPAEALPDIFKICRQHIEKRYNRQRQSESGGQVATSEPASSTKKCSNTFSEESSFNGEVFNSTEFVEINTDDLDDYIVEALDESMKSLPVEVVYEDVNTFDKLEDTDGDQMVVECPPESKEKSNINQNDESVSLKITRCSTENSSSHVEDERDTMNNTQSDNKQPTPVEAITDDTADKLDGSDGYTMKSATRSKKRRNKNKVGTTKPSKIARNSTINSLSYAEDERDSMNNTENGNEKPIPPVEIIEDDIADKLEGTDSDTKVVKNATRSKKRANMKKVEKTKPSKIARNCTKNSSSHVDKNRDTTNNTESDSEQPTQFHLTIDTQVVGKNDFSNPVLAKSYPDYIYFEKNARSINYTLVFFGERFNSAHYGVHYTYWQCAHRRRFSCKANLTVANDYTAFERRFHHTHEKINVKEGTIFTPHQALPDLFKITKSLSAWKSLRTGNGSNLDETIDESERSAHINDCNNIAEDDSKRTETVDKQRVTKKIAGTRHSPIDIPEECRVYSVPEMEKMLVLADSYPESFHFEKGPRQTYFTMIYKGERYNTPCFTPRTTYWRCANKRRFDCSAVVSVSNDYLTFERRNEHNHEQQPEKEENVYTPKEEALPLIFEACRRTVYKKCSHDMVKRLWAEKAINLQKAKESKSVKNQKSSRDIEDDSLSDKFFGFGDVDK
ncbi:uncharacterized protein LOC128735407 [Sabethes cyaneus]|uniref:uncharacterized protein LOC128735407 n=1 Tax=Sabethes cyaneus TaxID=53552 RepID=UPI00237E53A9|nr:uncharacterized protein LOC128735407 [Sabethes cyaneus]